MVVGSFGRSLQRRATVVGTTSKEETVFDSLMRYEALTRKRNAGMERNEIGYTECENVFYFLEMCIVKSFLNNIGNSTWMDEISVSRLFLVT